MNRDEVLDILRKAYQIEVDGYTFYSMTADRADKPAVQELFGKLAQDEVQHQAFLRGVLQRYDQLLMSASAAASALATKSSNAASRPFSPSLALNKVGRVVFLKPLYCRLQRISN